MGEHKVCNPFGMCVCLCVVVHVCLHVSQQLLWSVQLNYWSAYENSPDRKTTHAHTRSARHTLTHTCVCHVCELMYYLIVLHL